MNDTSNDRPELTFSSVSRRALAVGPRESVSPPREPEVVRRGARGTWCPGDQADVV